MAQLMRTLACAGEFADKEVDIQADQSHEREVIAPCRDHYVVHSVTEDCDGAWAGMPRQ